MLRASIETLCQTFAQAFSDWALRLHCWWQKNVRPVTWFVLGILQHNVVTDFRDATRPSVRVGLAGTVPADGMSMRKAQDRDARRSHLGGLG